MDKETKQHLSIVMNCHVDSGKSTTIGHLICKMGGVPDEILEQYEKEAAEIGEGTYKYAWILDKLKAEREQATTVDISTWKIETQSKLYTLIDVLGHRDLAQNMITAAFQADAAILVVSAVKGEFEIGISKDGQTREHPLYTFTMGVKQMFVVINKMDWIEWDEERFNEIKNEVLMSIRKIGYRTDKMDFIPISGYSGDNLIEKSDNIPWYTGPTLIEAIDTLNIAKRAMEKPLRLPIRDVCKVGGIGTVAVGRVETGIMKPGMTLTFAPKGISEECRLFEMHDETASEAKAGDIVRFNIKRLSVKDIKRGYVASDPHNDPAVDTESFNAQIIILNHPGEIVKGYTPILHVHTAHVACKFEELISKIDRRTRRMTEDQPKNLKTGEAGIVKLVPIKPLWIEAFYLYPPLGRFIVRDMRQTIAVGVVMAVTKKDKPQGYKPKKK